MKGFGKYSPLEIYDNPNYNFGEFGLLNGENNWWGERIKLELSPTVYSKMVHYTQRASNEISGFGKIRKIGNRIIITNVKIFKQVCNSVHTSLNEEELSLFMVNLIKVGEEPGKWKLWWHSHSNSNVFWSSTDTNNMERHSKESYLLSICMNKKIEMIGRIDDKGNSANIPVKVQPIRGRLKEDCYREVKEKVKNKRSYGAVKMEEGDICDMIDNQESLVLENLVL